jgi:DNA-directed RNA polymerase specialized sigma24 family protein
VSAAFDLVGHLRSREVADPHGPLDDRLIAPDEWALLGDLVDIVALRREMRLAVPANDLPGAPAPLRLVPSAKRGLTQEHLDAIASAIARLGREFRLKPETRADLKQELSEFTLRHDQIPNSWGAFIYTIALGKAIDHIRSEDRHRELNKQYRLGIGSFRHDKAIWQPRWYPAHPDATEFAPLACAEARLMHVRQPRVDAYAWGEAFAEALDACRTLSHKSTTGSKKAPIKIGIGTASSLRGEKFRKMNTQHSTPRPRGYIRPPQATQIGVREFIARHGESIAFAHFGVARGTIARCAAGLTIQGATLRAIEEGLRTPVPDQLESEAI